jgi:hypothetical protein
MLSGVRIWGCFGCSLVRNSCTPGAACRKRGLRTCLGSRFPWKEPIVRVRNAAGRLCSCDIVRAEVGSRLGPERKGFCRL